MLEYRAYLIGRNGHIVHRVDLLCDDDEAAKVRAQLLVDIHTVELWQGGRLVASLSHEALGATIGKKQSSEDEPKDKPSRKTSRSEEARQIIEEYAAGLREVIKNLRKPPN
jgi:hypothetical protein